MDRFRRGLILVLMKAGYYHTKLSAKLGGDDPSTYESMKRDIEYFREYGKQRHYG